METLKRLDRKIAGALAGWAAMALVARNGGADRVLGNRAFLARALCEALAGSGLILVARWRGERLPAVRGWGALVLLAGVSFAGELLWRPYIDQVLHVHYVRSGLGGMLLLLSPLWLALLAALRWVPDAVPRQTVGAALAGLTAFCLLLPGDVLTPRMSELPGLALYFLQALATVWAWSVARHALAGAPVAAVAGSGLLVSAMVHGVAAGSIPNKVARPFASSDMWIPLAVATMATALGGWLWYWLLLRVELAIFATHPLALWLAALLVSLVLFGFLEWHLDLAVALGLGALVTALRARMEDDEPLRLDVSAAGPH